MLSCSESDLTAWRAQRCTPRPWPNERRAPDKDKHTQSQREREREETLRQRFLSACLFRGSTYVRIHQCEGRELSSLDGCEEGKVRRGKTKGCSLSASQGRAQIVFRGTHAKRAQHFSMLYSVLLKNSLGVVRRSRSSFKIHKKSPYFHTPMRHNLPKNTR